MVKGLNITDFTERDNKQTMIDLREISTNWFKPVMSLHKAFKTAGSWAQMEGETRTVFTPTRQRIDPGAGKITEQKGTIDLDLSGHSKFL